MHKKANILYIVDKITHVGGIGKIVIDKSSYLSDCGFRVAILALDYEEQKMFFPISSKIKIFTSQQTTKSNFKNLKYRINQFWRIKKIVQPDFVIFTRPFFLDNAICGFLFPKIKRITELHSCYEVFNYGEHCFKTFEMKQDKSFVLLLQKIFTTSYRIITLTRRDAELWNYPKIQVIPNFTPFCVHSKEETSQDCKVVISVGRLSFEKGFKYLIEVWSKIHIKYPDWRLEIFGDGADREYLQKLIDEYALGMVITLKGYSKNIAEAYLQSSFYVMTSLFEGLPLSLIEAQKCGLPIVSFDLPSGPAEIINHGKDGFLCEYLNVDDLSEKISLLIENETLRKEMGTNAQENAKRFSPEVVMKQWLELFEEGKKQKISLIKSWEIRLNSLAIILHYLKVYLKTCLKTNKNE